MVGMAQFHLQGQFSAMAKTKFRSKAKSTSSHARKKRVREPYDIVLIVCEGEKTEPFYLESLRQALRLSNANIRICGKECGSAPISVVNFALEQYKSEGMIYDRIYCVFDKDKHDSYFDAKSKVANAKLHNGATIHHIVSIPCFEIWVLLHFLYTTRSFCAAGNSSNCALVIDRLKEFIPDYEKGNKNIYPQIYEKTSLAIQRSKQLEVFHETSGTDNPSTKIYELVEYLQGLNTL